MSIDIVPKIYSAGWQSSQFWLKFGWATRIQVAVWRVL